MSSTPNRSAIHVDVADHLAQGRSSSAAKNADAVFTISFARRNSAFSRRNRRTSAWVSLTTPAFWPLSTSACSIQRRNVSGEMSNFGAAAAIA